MLRRYPFAIEFVESERVSVPRDVGHGATVSERLRVDVPLFRRTIRGYADLSDDQRSQGYENALEEAKLAAFEKFVLSLQISAEYEPYFNVDALESKPQRQYALLLAETHWNRLRLQVASPGGGRSLRARRDDFEFEFLTHPRLNDNESYLVAADKYLLYLYPREIDDGVLVSRSEFIDRAPESGPPLSMRPERLLQELFDSPDPAAVVAEAEGDEDESHDGPARCPQCGGRLVMLSAEEAFCLECDWDNLKTLVGSPSRRR